MQVPFADPVRRSGKAVRRESATAVAYHWGVRSQTVSKWRQALGVERWTPGTARLAIYTIRESFTRERRLAISRARKGKPIPLSEAARRRYRRRLREAWTPQRRRKMAARLKAVMQAIRSGAGGCLGGPLGNEWKPEEERLLGTAPDREVARLLGRTRVAVSYRRCVLGIAPAEKRPWTGQEERLLGTKPDKEVARLLGRSIKSVRSRRSLRKVRAYGFHGRAWTPSENRWLGIMPDAEVARRVNRSESAVKARRDQLGIALKHPKFRPWTTQEE